MSDRAVNGDFHVIRMDGLFHVVFRPDSDPEWFRIIGTFFTYERAYSYCDIERVSVWMYKDIESGVDQPESHTGDEEVAGLRSAPIQFQLPESSLDRPDGIAELVRNVYDGGEHVEPHAVEDFSDHPNEDEPPKEYHDRAWALAISKEADKPVCAQCGGPRSPGAQICNKCYRKTPHHDFDDEGLTPKQRAVLQFFQGHANPMQLVNATYNQIAQEADVSKGSIVYLVETLERKGFIEIVERGGATRSAVFKLTVTTEAEVQAQ